MRVIIPIFNIEVAAFLICKPKKRANGSKKKYLAFDLSVNILIELVVIFFNTTIPDPNHKLSHSFRHNKMDKFLCYALIAIKDKRRVLKMELDLKDKQVKNVDE